MHAALSGPSHSMICKLFAKQNPFQMRGPILNLNTVFERQSIRLQVTGGPVKVTCSVYNLSCNDTFT